MALCMLGVLLGIGVPTKTTAADATEYTYVKKSQGAGLKRNCYVINLTENDYCVSPEEAADAGNGQIKVPTTLTIHSNTNKVFMEDSGGNQLEVNDTDGSQEITVKTWTFIQNKNNILDLRGTLEDITYTDGSGAEIKVTNPNTAMVYVSIPVKEIPKTNNPNLSGITGTATVRNGNNYPQTSPAPVTAVRLTDSLATQHNADWLLSVPYTAENVTIAPQPEDSQTTVTGISVYGSSISSGTPISMSAAKDGRIELTISVETGTGDVVTHRAVIVRHKGGDRLKTLSATNTDGTNLLLNDFNPSKLDYTLTVGVDTEEITVEAEAEGESPPADCVTIDGNVGTSKIVPLTAGATTTVVITADPRDANSNDGTSRPAQTYTIKITRSTEHRLKSLGLRDASGKNITLAPLFDPKVLTGYSTSVENAVSSIQLTAVSLNPNATIRVRNNNVLVADPSNIALAEGENKITIQVIDSGASGKTYELSITRRPNAPPPYLSSLTVDGTSVDGFAPANNSYQCYVDPGKTSISLAAVPQNTSHTVEVSVGSTQISPAGGAYTVPLASTGSTVITVKLTDPANAGNTFSYILSVEHANVATLPELSDLTIDGTSIAGRPGQKQFVVQKTGTLNFTATPATGATCTVMVDNAPLAPTSGDRYTATVAAGSQIQIIVEANGARTVYTISVGGLSMNDAALASGTYGESYTAALAETSNLCIYSFSVTAGSLPGGLTLDPGTGQLSGTPTKAGSYSFTVRAEESIGGTVMNTATRTFSLTVQPKELTLRFARISRTYDGTTNIPVPEPSIDGLLPGDTNADVGLVRSGTPRLASANQGTRAISGVSWRLTGPKAGDYKLTQPQLEAYIMPVRLQIPTPSVQGTEGWTLAELTDQVGILARDIYGNPLPGTFSWDDGDSAILSGTGNTWKNWTFTFTDTNYISIDGTVGQLKGQGSNAAIVAVSPKPQLTWSPGNSAWTVTAGGLETSYAKQPLDVSPSLSGWSSHDAAWNFVPRRGTDYEILYQANGGSWDTVFPKDAGSYQMRISPLGTAVSDRYIFPGDTSLVIQPYQITGAEFSFTGKDGSTLGDLEKPESILGVGGDELSGVFTWDLGDEEKIDFEQTYAWTFTLSTQDPNYASGPFHGTIQIQKEAPPPSTSQFTITFRPGEHGSLAGKSSLRVKRGELIPETPEVSCEAGWQFLGWSLDGETVIEVLEVKVTKNLSFTALYEPASDLPGKPPAYTVFADITQADWFSGSIDFVFQHSYMTGMTENLFAPQGAVTRAGLLGSLQQLTGATASPISSFIDVKEDSWYAATIGWALENHICTGIGNGLFEPERACTRAEMVVMIYRYCRAMGLLESFPSGQGTLHSFGDRDEIPSWAMEAMVWAVDSGLITGIFPDVLAANQLTTRAQVATVMQRLMEHTSLEA